MWSLYPVYHPLERNKTKMGRTIILQDYLRELRAIAVLTLVAMVHEVENCISCIKRQIEIKIIL